MKGINKATIVGTLGADPEVRYTADGTAIATLSIATNERWKDKATGEQKERTEWHRVKFFGRQGEICGEYLTKGSQLYVEGSLRTDKYTDKDGIERYSTEIVGGVMQMLGKPPERKSSDSNGAAAGGGGAGQQRGPRPQSTGKPAQAPSNLPPQSMGTYDDDEIPF